MWSPSITIFFLLAIILYLPAGYCQEVWIIPEGGEDQGNLAGSFLAEPIGFQPQPGIGALPQSSNEILPPPAMAPTEIEFFNGPKVAKPGEKVTITWKVLNDCGVFLDNIPVESAGSHTYTVPLVGAADEICHQLKAYPNPCNSPLQRLPIEKELCIQIQKGGVPNAPSEINFTPRAPDAPTDFKFNGWTKTWGLANFTWKDNSADEDGFTIYNEKGKVASTGPNENKAEIPIKDSCGKTLTFYVQAFNSVGGSAISNKYPVVGLCPPKDVVLRLKVDPAKGEEKARFFIESAYSDGGDHGPFWVDVHVITQSPSGVNLTDKVESVPKGERLEVDPPCSGYLLVYGIPRNAAGAVGTTNALKFGRLESDPKCNYYDPTKNLEYTNYQYRFVVGSSMGQQGPSSYVHQFPVYRPGPISTKVSWGGEAADLDLILEGPGNFKASGDRTNPKVLTHVVTQEDLDKGYTWKISIITHEGKWANGEFTLVYPKNCSFAGAWDTNFGRLNIKLLGDGQTVTGNYEHNAGEIDGSISDVKIEGKRLVGKWRESPTYKPPDDAGDFELYMSEDCKSFIGYWRYGYTGDWDGDWDGTRVDDLFYLSPKGGGGWG
jgi:hypothetical protein